MAWYRVARHDPLIDCDIRNSVIDVPDDRARPRRTRIVSMVGILVGFVGIAFVIRTLMSSWDDVTDAYAQLDALGLLFSLALGLAAMTWIGVLWTRMLGNGSGRTPVVTRSALSWYFVGQLGKYVPGAIWPIVGRAEMATRAGVARGVAYGATGRSMATTYLGAALTVCLGSFASWTDPIIGGSFALGIIAAWWIATYSRVRHRIDRVVTRVIPSAPSLPDANDLAITAVRHMPAWILMSLSTSIVASAFQADIGIMHMMYVTSLSWLVGFVVVGVPGGLGVREAVFIALLGPTVGDGVAASIAIASRVVFIAVDLAGAAVSTVAARITRIRSAKT